MSVLALLLIFSCHFTMMNYLAMSKPILFRLKGEKKRVWHKYSSCLTSSSATEPILYPGKSQGSALCPSECKKQRKTEQEIKKKKSEDI